MEYHARCYQRKQRQSPERWNIELLISDCIEDLEFNTFTSFMRIFKCDIGDIDTLSEQVLASVKTIDLADTKTKHATATAVKVFLKTHDLELAYKYSLAKTVSFLRGARGAMKRCSDETKCGKSLKRLLKATESYGVFKSLQRYSQTRSIQTRVAAEKKLSVDPKQAAKKQVFEMWQSWQTGSRHYRSQSAFARDMLDKFDVLGSQSVVEGWCRKWKSSPS